MFRLHRNLKSQDLLTSQLFDDRSFYKAFIHDLRRSEAEVIIESPYLTKRRAYELAPIFKKLNKRGVKIRINTRIPQHHTRDLCEQSLQAIQILKNLGVRVFVCRDYRHRKVAIIDGTVLWEGSLNILSQSNSREIMRRTTSREMVKQMIRFTGLTNKYW